MGPNEVDQALTQIANEHDPTVRQLLLASLVTRVFAAHNIELVVVGGSAIEFYTEGAYSSGDLDLCLVSPLTLGARKRQEIMGELKGTGGPRSWQVGEAYVDILGAVETISNRRYNELEAPFGPIKLYNAEELLVERVLVSIYPERHPPAADCAKKLIAVGLTQETEMDWTEVRRIAEQPTYGIFRELKTIVSDVANQLEIESPYNP